MADKKERAKERYSELAYDKKNYYEEASKKERKAIYAYAEGYKAFLDAAKTEREACDVAVAMAQAKGFTEYHFGDPLIAGDRKYFVNRGKSVVVFRVGTRDLETDGMRIIASHIDAPRVDIKQNPLYEEGGLCFLKTHYYGGIKKYQWTAIPLALHGEADASALDHGREHPRGARLRERAGGRVRAAEAFGAQVDAAVRAPQIAGKRRRRALAVEKAHGQKFPVCGQKLDEHLLPALEFGKFLDLPDQPHGRAAEAEHTGHRGGEVYAHLRLLKNLLR